MKFVGILATLAGIFGIIALLQMQRVEAGYVGIRVDLLGDDKGVSSEEVGPGRYWIGINEDLYEFPTFSQNHTFEGEENGLTFQSKEGMNIGADVGVTYTLDGTKVSDLFQRYRKGADEITNVVVRNSVRDALVNLTSVMKVNAIYGEGKAGLMETAQENVYNDLEKHGIIIEKLYWVGALRLPEQVVAAIDAEISANSKARQRDNEIAESIAEAQKEREKAKGRADAITAEADAQAAANLKLAASITPELVDYMRVQRWDGVMPKVTSGATPLISLDIE